ncbi:MAG: GntR family transcriptional regulator [Anaerolineales bacterium]|nr:GntR family transcriptional regulator [Anaerolineales bacterium]
MANGMDKLEQYLMGMDHIDESDSRLLRQVAYERIQEAITHASLEPGDPLSETRISKALGISRTPVREALQQLAQEGLVHIIPGRAITVAAPSMQDIFDAIHVRELLEPEVVRLAAESLPPRQREVLQTLTQELEHAARRGDRAAWSKIDIKWHETLNNSCPNRLLGQLTMQARNRMQKVGADNRVTDQYLIDGSLEHRQIIEAILAGDGSTAEHLMREHIKALRENMVKRLARS